MNVNQDVVKESFNNLLDKVPEGLAEKVKEKYEQDSKEFLEALEAATPSKDPGYWAKKSCRKCHGRGTEGTKHVFPPNTPAKVNEKGEYENVAFQIPIKCNCADKNYSKWLVEFRKFFNALREQDKEGSHE